MNKAIALAAIAALAMGSEQFGDDELNVFKSIGNGLKKAGQYVVSHPQVIAQGAKILAHDDEELFNIHNALHKAEEGAKKAGHYVAEHPEVINQAIQILKNFKHDDEELFNIKNAIHKAEEGIHKAEHYVKDHRHQIEQGAKKAVDYIQQHPEVVNQAIEIIKNLRHHDDEELFHLGKAISKATHLVKDGANIVKDVKTGNIGGLINHGAQTIRDIKHDDEELFKLGKVVKNVAHAAGKVGHVVKDGVNLYKDVQTGNIGGIINHGAQTVRDIKGLKHDDEELFNIHNAIHKAEEGVKKAGHFVYEHRQEISHDLKKAYEYAQQHPEQVKKAIEIIKKIAHHDDEELFKLGKVVKNVAHAAGKVSHIAKDGINIVKDVKTGNIGGLINHGAQTIKDIKNLKHDDEELFHLGKAISKATHLVKDGANIVKDVKTGNIGGLINHGAQTVKDIKNLKHDDEELFHLGKAISKATHLVKDGANIVKDVKTGNIGGLINHGAQTIRDIKHDDEELFNLGTLINDGLNIYKDVKTHNYGGLVQDGIQTVKDVKQATHGKKFLRH